ncbi:MAG: hypothetical protein QGG36_06545 [Pirellulaceae bacterium]|nr:hypothetical protein [Pirellulaceae bacterium]MDP7015438.1 hypothetical protein [Pirellulaceae bacterium]
MPSFTLVSLGPVTAALDAISRVHGAYRAIDLLGQALSEVEESDEFSDEAEQAERAEGLAYEGPDGLTRNVLKAMFTGVNAGGQSQNALAELVALVITRLSVGHGAKVLAATLAVAGVHPGLTLLTIKVCLLLLRTERGKKIVREALPKLRAAVERSGEAKKEWSELLSSVGDDPKQRVGGWMQQARSITASTADRISDASKTVKAKSWDRVMDGLDLAGEQTSEPTDEN